MNKATRLTAALAVLLALASCTAKNDSAGGSSDNDARMTAAKKAATALASGNFVDSDSANAPETLTKEYPEVVKPLDGLKPTVSVDRVTENGENKAIAVMKWSWPFAPTPWTYESTVHLVKFSEKWAWNWAPTAVHPELDGGKVFVVRNRPAQRGEIHGNKDYPLVTMREVVEIGLDKPAIKTSEWETSARALAKFADVDPEAFAKEVQANGPQAFVVAITQRGNKAPEGLSAIPGALAKPGTRMLAPTKDFAASILGTVGDATAEDIKKSNGAIKAGETVGRSGLQLAHDKTLRGTPGVDVYIAAPDVPLTPTNKPMFSIKPVNGTTLKITMDFAWQQHLDRVMAEQPDKKAAAVVEVGTGRILAMSTSPKVNNEPWANWGKYPPGSTFKIASSLALIRAGANADSPVNCPDKYPLSGINFKNYPEYPKEMNGSIALRDAFAHSCNTAFMDGILKLPDGALNDAAGSLGIGTDYDAGFMSFYGEAPVPDNPVDKGAQAFGQSTILVSPMSSAGMSASVASGKTIVPYLIEGKPITPKTKPLTAAEAEQLQLLMNAMVNSYHVPSMKGIFQGAKTGTAEFGDIKNNTDAHTWLTGYTSTKPGGVAISLFAWAGKYGSDMAPIMVDLATQK